MTDGTREQLWAAIRAYVEACGGKAPTSRILGTAEQELHAREIDQQVWRAQSDALHARVLNGGVP